MRNSILGGLGELTPRNRLCTHSTQRVDSLLYPNDRLQRIHLSVFAYEIQTDSQHPMFHPFAPFPPLSHTFPPLPSIRLSGRGVLIIISAKSPKCLSLGRNGRAWRDRWRWRVEDEEVRIEFDEG